MSGILLFISVLPSVVLGYYVYKKDKIEPEPAGLLAKLFIFGALTIIPGIILELILVGVLEPIGISEDSGLLGLFLYFLIGVGLVEEGCKWFVLKATTWNNKEFDHIFDALVYAVFASLGFATIENILYVFQNGLYTGLLRAVLSVPGHAFFGVYMGYYYGIAKQCQMNNNTRLYKDNLIKSIMIPTLIHGLFDFLLSTEYEEIIVLYFVLVIFLYVTAFVKIKRFSNIQSNLQNPFGIHPAKNQVLPQQVVQQPVPQPMPIPAQQPVPQPQPIPQILQQPQPQVQPIQQPIPQPVQPMVQQPVQPMVQEPVRQSNFCPNCGTPCKDGIFCSNCGFKLK